MDTRETLLETLRGMIARRDAEQAKIDELNRGIEGIQIALKLLKPQRSGDSGRGVLIGAIRAIIADWDSDATVGDVETALKSKFPGLQVKTTSVSSALARLADQHVIQLVQKGAGRKAAVYRKKEPGNTMATTQAAA